MLDNYRREYVGFYTQWMREHYLYLSGQKCELDLAPIYERYNHLFTRESVAQLKRDLNAQPEHFETERNAIRRLLVFAVEQFLESSANELTQEISLYEARTNIETSGRSLTFQESAVSLRTERDRHTRRQIYQRRADVIKGSDDLRAERLGRLHQGARYLGFESYRALHEELRQFDYSTLGREAESLLARTESVYLSRLDQALKRDLGVTITRAERCDALYFLHLSRFDHLFPASTLLGIYRETMARLGIDVESQTNIVVDSEPRPRKNPRAFCMPIAVPDEIVLVLRPMGGQTDYQTLLHEAGHAQHYGWTSPSLRPEFKYTGDYALTETYAFLFNHLISDADWLGTSLGITDSSDLISSVMLTRLYQTRRYVGKLIYELELHAGLRLDRARELYADIQTAATRFETDGTEFLFDVDDGFYSANYVRAWAFEVMLREHLKSRFGRRWWASRPAGDFLKEVWETGDRYTAEEMAQQIGVGPITFDALIDEFNRVLQH